MKLHTCEQRTPEWFALRIGRITATSFATMANGRPDTIETLCLKTAAEKVTGKSCDDGYCNAAMEDGINTEELARQAYETNTFEHVQQVGFIELDDTFGFSPDGLVGDVGGVEIKCPQPHTHLKYLTAGREAWLAYKWQVQGALWVSGRPWWDFVSFCPCFPPDKQLLIERVTPDAKCIDALHKGAAFCRQRIAELLEGVGYAAQSPVCS
jgi:hypothetical protein